MIKALKFLLVFGVTLSVIAGIYYSFLDRFDVVACLLILINAGAFGLVNILEQEREHRIDDPLKRIFEPDNHMEFFDEGYLTGLKDFLQYKFIQYHSFLDMEFFKRHLLEPTNGLTKVVEAGRFIIAPPDASNREYRIVFLTRSI